MRIANGLVAALALWALCVAAPASAGDVLGIAPNYVFPDGSRGFAFVTSGGPTNPEVIVGFNPQPDPPGFGDSRYLPGGPGTTIFTPASDSNGYGMVFSFLTGGGGNVGVPDAPNRDGITSFRFNAVQDGVTHTFDVAMAITGPGSVADWAAFNPQPDPPGDWFGAQFSLAGDPDLTFRIFEDGKPLSLSLVPEPAAWAMMLAGFFVLGAAARRRRRVEPAAV